MLQRRFLGGWAGRLPAVFLLIVSCTGSLCAQAGDNGQEQSLTKEQQEELKTLVAEFQKAESPATRRQYFDRMKAVSPLAMGPLCKYVEYQLSKGTGQYMKMLDRHIRPAYIKHLATLSEEQVYRIQWMRRLWRHYILTTTTQKDFQANFLGPCKEVSGIVLLDVENITDEEIAAQRKLLIEFGEYLAECHQALGIKPDPTTRLRSPTGVAYPPLDSPPTFLDKLSFLERYLVLANTVAPPGARKTLLECAKVAQEIDVEESEFVLYANEARMLSGSIVWRVDPVVCACTRDHSNDRKAGRASGHMSDVPGKRGFTDRLKLFGAKGSSEGAGGGRDGRNYLHGLSYGGGHTGPLYSLKRNVVGVGRRDGVYTSIYRTDSDIKHSSAAQTGELYLPPGLSRSHVKTGSLRSISQLIGAGNFSASHARIKSTTPANDYDKMLLRFFDAAVRVEIDWTVSKIKRLEGVGDLFAAKHQLMVAKKQLGGIEDFNTKIAAVVQRLSAPEIAPALRAGQTYYSMIRNQPNGQVLGMFCKKYPDTEYARAARFYYEKGLANAEKNSVGPLWYFIDKDPTITQFPYGPPKK